MVAFCVNGETRQAQQNHARMNAPHSVDDLARILVGRHNYRVTLIGVLPEMVIRASRGRLGRIVHFMPTCLKTVDDLAIDALVREEVHAALSGMG